MSGSGRAGGGRGNNRRHPFRHRENDPRHGEGSGGGQPPSRHGASPKSAASAGSAASTGSAASSRAPSGNHEKRTPLRGQESQGRQGRGGSPRRDGEPRGGKQPYIERPKWTPPKINTGPLPLYDCPWCGKPIRDVPAAMADKDTGEPVHFDCVAARIAGGETLEKGDILTYIGGGRFGVVNSGNPAESRGFKIKKIIEWENKDRRAGWRSGICDHYSVT